MVKPCLVLIGPVRLEYYVKPTPTENVLFYDSFVWLLTPFLDILKKTFTLFSFFTTTYKIWAEFFFYLI